MPSGWVGLPQIKWISESERVVLRLPLPGVVVTCFVTGSKTFPSKIGSFGRTHTADTRSALGSDYLIPARTIPRAACEGQECIQPMA